MIGRIGLLGLAAFALSCNGDRGYCFDSEHDYSIAYEVELLEKLAESTCTQSVLETGTKLTVVQVGYYGASATTCGQAALGLVAGLEDKDLVGLWYNSVGRLPDSLQPIGPGGVAMFSIVVETPECRTRASIAGVSPVPGATVDDLIASERGLIWQVPIYKCVSRSQVQDESSCVDYFTSRMKKISWKLEY